MGNNGIFNAVNSKVSVMTTQMLKDEDFLQLIDCNNMEDQLEYLKESTYYGEFIDSETKYWDIEIVGRKRMDKDIGKLEHFLFSKYKPFIKYFRHLQKYEDIKLIIRTILRREDIDKTKSKLVFIKDDPRYEIDSSTRIEEFIERFKGERIYGLLKPYLDMDLDRELLYMEMNLDRYYYSELMHLTKTMGEEDFRAAKTIIGEYIDMLNVEWIYRAVKFYDIPREVVFNFTILNGHIFDIDKLKEMAYMETKDLIEFVESTKYAFLFESSHEIDLYMERRMERYLYYKCKRAIHSSERNLRKTIGYLLLKELEIRDVSTVIEAKKFELSNFDIASYLIRKIEGSEAYEN